MDYRVELAGFGNPSHATEEREATTEVSTKTRAETKTITTARETTTAQDEVTTTATDATAATPSTTAIPSEPNQATNSTISPNSSAQVITKNRSRNRGRPRVGSQLF